MINCCLHDRDFRSINAIGRRDVDPLAAMGCGGGMLFDPFAENRNRLLESFRGSGIPEPLPRYFNLVLFLSFHCKIC